MRTSPDQTAFTLTELLVVIAVMGILAALLLPSLARAKRKSQQVSCTSNLHQIDLALRMYADDNKDVLPFIGPRSPEGDAVWQRFRPLVQNYLGIQSRASSQDKIFACPADRFCIGFDDHGPIRGGPAHEDHTGTNFTSYLFNGFNTALLPPAPGIAGAPMGAIPNPARTVLVAEGPAFVGFSWHEPHQELLFCDALNEVGYVDGHVSFVKIYWKGPSTKAGAACYYDPPPGYAYTWSGK